MRRSSLLTDVRLVGATTMMLALWTCAAIAPAQTTQPATQPAARPAEFDAYSWPESGDLRLGIRAEIVSSDDRGSIVRFTCAAGDFGGQRAWRIAGGNTWSGSIAPDYLFSKVQPDTPARRGQTTVISSPRAWPEGVVTHVPRPKFIDVPMNGIGVVSSSTFLVPLPPGSYDVAARLRPEWKDMPDVWRQDAIGDGTFQSGFTRIELRGSEDPARAEPRRP